MVPWYLIVCVGLTCTFVNIVWIERVVISFIRLTVSSPGQIMLRCNKYSRYFARCLVIQQYKEKELGFWKVLPTRRLHYSPKKRKSHLEHKSHHENHTDTRDYIAMIGNDEFMAENRGILARFSSARHFFCDEAERKKEKREKVTGAQAFNAIWFVTRLLPLWVGLGRLGTIKRGFLKEFMSWKCGF